MELPAEILQYGSAGAVVLVVLLFINYIKNRDQQFTKIITEHMTKEAEAFTGMTNKLDTIPNAFKELSDSLKESLTQREKRMMRAIKKRSGNGNGHK